MKDTALNYVRKFYHQDATEVTQCKEQENQGSTDAETAFEMEMKKKREKGLTHDSVPDVGGGGEDWVWQNLTLLTSLRAQHFVLNDVSHLDFF